MSAEELVRAKHRIQAEIVLFTSIVNFWRRKLSLFSANELEIIAAKVIDGISDDRQHEAKIKLYIISSIIQRRARDFKVSSFKKFWMAVSMDYIEEKFVTGTITLPLEVDEETLNSIARAD